MGFILDYLNGIIEELPYLLETTKPIVFFEKGDFRISSFVTTTWIAMFLIIAFVLIITSKLEIKPTTRRQAIAEKIVFSFYSFIKEILGDTGRKVYGMLGSFFLIILVFNFMWVIPTFTVPTSSYSTTLALALLAYLYSQMIIIKKVNLKNYIISYGQPNPLMIIGNVLSIIARPLSLSMRLFGNMFAGKILDSLIMMTLPLLVPIAFSLLSILAGVIQAYVFTLLVTMFINEGLE